MAVTMATLGATASGCRRLASRPGGAGYVVVLRPPEGARLTLAKRREVSRMRTTPGPLHFLLHYLVVVPLQVARRAAYWAVAALDRATKAAEHHRDRLRRGLAAGYDDLGHRRDDAQHEGGTTPRPPGGGAGSDRHRREPLTAGRRPSTTCWRSTEDQVAPHLPPGVVPPDRTRGGGLRARGDPEGARRAWARAAGGGASGPPEDRPRPAEGGVDTVARRGHPEGATPLRPMCERSPAVKGRDIQPIGGAPRGRQCATGPPLTRRVCLDASRKAPQRTPLSLRSSYAAYATILSHHTCQQEQDCG